MVSSSHEALHRIFQKDPTLFATTFDRALGITFPSPKEVAVLNTDLTEIEPLERRVDTALLVNADAGRHVIIIEAQSRPEAAKRVSWPYYVAYLHNKHECPVSLLVVTGDARTQRWAGQPIKIGHEDAPSQITLPKVAGPDNMPVITDVEHARQDVLLAVLSALTHRHSKDIDAILEALAAALSGMDSPTTKYLVEFTGMGLGKTPAGKKWRALMKRTKYGFESEVNREWRAEGREEGRLEAMVAAVLRVLEVRGLAVPAEVARRVKECTDLTVLDDLLRRAATAQSAEDLFVAHTA